MKKDEIDKAFFTLWKFWQTNPPSKAVHERAYLGKLRNHTIGKDICVYPGCDEKITSLGFCAKHRQSYKHYGDALEVNESIKPKCKVTECGRPAESKGYCSMHYTRFKKYGDPNYVAKRGAKSKK